MDIGIISTNQNEIFLPVKLNFKAAKTQFERDLAARDEAAEEKRKGLLRQLRDVEGDLEEGESYGYWVLNNFLNI